MEELDSLPEKLVYFVDSVCLQGVKEFACSEIQGSIEHEGETSHAG